MPMQANNSSVPGDTDDRLLVAVAMLVALNILGLSYYLYFYTGTYKYIGDYMGWPLYRFYPDPLLLPLSFTALLSAFALYFLSTRIALKPRLLLLVFLFLVATSTAVIGIEYAQQVKPHIIVYGGKTDSFVIQYAAAQSLIHGRNPYTIDYSSVLLERLAVTKYTFIYRPDSTSYSVKDIIGFVSRFDYPAMAALYYVIPAALHINGVYWDALILGVALYLVYARTRGQGRYLHLAVFLSGMFTFFGPLYIGDPQTGWVAPLMAAIALYDRPVIAGILVGLAASYREQALIFALFLGIIYLREEDLRPKFARLLFSSLTSALIVNAPFLIASPREFISNVLIPARLNLYPKGFGLSSLRYIGLALPRDAYTVLFLVSLVVLFVAALLWYDRFKHVVLALPGIAFLLYYRPMPTYYEYFLVLNVMWLLVRGDIVSKRVSVDAYDIAIYSALFTLLSVVLVYTGSPRRLVKYLPSLTLAGVYSIVIIILIIVLSVMIFLYYSRKRLFLVGEDLRNMRLLARFLVASLTIALIVQSLYPQTHLLIITPYFTDYNSATSILSGTALASIHNPYANYQTQLAKLLEDHRIGAIYLMLPYTHKPITIQAILSYTNPYARETFNLASREWTIITWKTGSIAEPIIYSIARSSFVVARLLSGLSLSSGFILLLFALYYNRESTQERLKILAIISSAIASTTLFYLTTPDESLQAGIMLGSLALVILLRGDHSHTRIRSLVYLLIGFLSTAGMLTLAAAPILYSKISKRYRKAFLAGIAVAVTLSLALGGEYSVYSLIYPVMEKGISFYNLYYLVWGSGLILTIVEKTVLALLIAFLSLLIADRGLKARHTLLLLLLILAASTPYCRIECIVFTFMYSMILDILER